MSKNKDQSNKSLNGKNFNKLVANRFDGWHDGYERIFFGSEVPCCHRELINRDQERITSAKFDQVLFIVLHNVKKVLVISLDNTTTIRERVEQKTNEGVSLQCLKEPLKEMILQEYPDLSDYDFVFTMTLSIPDELSPTLKNFLQENDNVHNATIGINYKTAGNWVTNEYRDGLDFAARLSEIIAVLNHIIDNQNKYIIDRGILSRVWIELYATTYENMPLCSLNLSKATRQRDYLIWYLEHYPKKYHREEIDEFLHDCKLTYKSSSTNKAKIKLIIQHLKNNFPPQVDFNILEDVEFEHDKLRKMGRLS